MNSLVKRARFKYFDRSEVIQSEVKSTVLFLCCTKQDARTGVQSNNQTGAVTRQEIHPCWPEDRQFEEFRVVRQIHFDAVADQ